MATDCRCVPLADLCTAIVDCEHRTAPTASRGIPSIRTTDIKDGRLDLEMANRVSEETYREWTARMVPMPGDLILAREAPVGEVGIVPPGKRVCLGQRTVLLRTDATKLHSRYLLYLLLTSEMRHAMVSKAEGSVVPHLNVADIRGLEIPCPPPLTEQHAIAAVLGAFDDKIELNRRMTQTLEAMAQALFQSWFVDFDPVRAKMAGRQPARMDAETAALFPASLQASAFGESPLGWQVQPLPDVFEVNPLRHLRAGVPSPYLEMSKVPTTSARVAAWEERPFASGTRFTNGDTLVARITPCLENGKTAYVDFLPPGAVGWGSTEYIVLRSKAPLPPEYAYFLARTESFRTHAIRNMSGTSGRQRVPVGCFSSYMVVVPNHAIGRRFGDTAREIFANMKRNDEQSATLAEARDTLLPKLLSGELPVADGKDGALP